MGEKIPNLKELEKEISDFLSKKFGNNVQIVSPVVLPQESAEDTEPSQRHAGQHVNFNLRPEELVAYLDRYMVKQDNAKAILSTKICTHFNRIKHLQTSPETIPELVGSIKNNVLMIGPTGVGKTYMVKLIARKIGVPFVKGDATKFSETGYVGGDVEDLVRDLVREANGDIELAQYGIIYIDEIDKIASSRNLIGADVSRTGVQRALLKPLEETEVDMKVPHDPISMIQEIERFRKTGKRESQTVNTKNILFIVSGAFSELVPIIKKRITDQGIGFGASLRKPDDDSRIFQQVRSEDLIEFGFESEFVGRLPVRSVFERLTVDDLFEILQNPNNPIILGKKLDFAAYGIDIKFSEDALRTLAKDAFDENTGARGLVSAVENALLPFEKKLPSTNIGRFAVTKEVIEHPKKSLRDLIKTGGKTRAFEQLAQEERKVIAAYVSSNSYNYGDRYGLVITPSRIRLIAAYYSLNVMDLGKVIETIKEFYDEVKALELQFYKRHDINIVLEDDAVDFIIEQRINKRATLTGIGDQLSSMFEHGLKLIREKTGRNRFFITREAMLDPEEFISSFLKGDLQKDPKPSSD
ncbi:ATP-dependent Clp protease ATP-binding subunit ClpX [Olavius algarvensis associated proteobacterium Delta 3]|nr:ATP-dependent Clp protease ATP-binding subunit ClpX [Olavius algarvensis associated proteobacterium Delta 3]